MRAHLRRIAHVARKDVFRVRWHLLLFAVLVGISTWYAVHPSRIRENLCVDGCGTPRDSAILTVELTMILTLLVLVASVVQEDSPTRRDAYWLSQPLSGLTVASAKMLTIFAIITAAVVVPHMMAVIAFDFEPTAIRWTVARSLYQWVSVALLLFIVAAVTPNLKAFIFTILASVLVDIFGLLWVDDLNWVKTFRSASVLGMRGDIWLLFAGALFVSIYATQTVGISRRRWAALGGGFMLAMLWEASNGSPIRVFTSATDPENKSLPAAHMTAYRGGAGFGIDVNVAAPPAGHRFRFVYGAATLLFNDGTTFVSASSGGKWILRQVAILNATSTALIDDRTLVRAHLGVSFEDKASERLKRESASLILDGFIEDQMRFRFGDIPIRPGASVQNGRQRFTIRNAPADSTPYRLGLEGIALDGPRIFGRVGDAMSSNDEKTAGTVSRLPWYINSFIREFPEEEFDFRVVFNERRDTLPLAEGGRTNTNASIPFSVSGLQRWFNAYSVRTEIGGSTVPSPNWISDGTLIISQWQHQSHRSVRVILPVRAQ